MKTNLYLFRKLKILFLFPACICFIVGCSDPLDELAKENTDAIITKAVRWICADIYIETYVDGQLIFSYSGTTCYPELEGGYPVYPWAGGSDPYIPDETPSSQGGGQGTATSWISQFTQLQGIYGYKSTFNLSEKNQLHAELYALENSDKIQYRNLLKKLKDKLAILGKRITFKMDPNSFAEGGYNPADTSILFVNKSAICEHIVLEELTHAVQHLCYYKESMVDGKVKNYDFETRVFQDLAAKILDPGYSACRALQSMDCPPEYAYEYAEFIQFLGDQKYFPAVAIKQFNDLCKRWPGGTKYLSNFSPLLLRDFFGHPIPIVQLY